MDSLVGTAFHPPARKRQINEMRLLRHSRDIEEGSNTSKPFPALEPFAIAAPLGEDQAIQPRRLVPKDVL